MASNVLEMRSKPRGTALERISQALALKRLQSLARLKRGDQKRLAKEHEPQVVYGDGGRYETTNTKMARLLAKDEL